MLIYNRYTGKQKSTSLLVQDQKNIKLSSEDGSVMTFMC